MTTFAPIFAPAKLRAAVGDRAWIAAMLEAERALVAALAAAELAPAGAVVAVAAAGVLSGSLVQEHQRAAGDWHAEWEALTNALLHAGGGAASIREALDGLEVFPDRMQENLDARGGLVLAEQVSFTLADRIGRAEAQALVAELRAGGDLVGALRSDERVRETLGADGLEAAVDPGRALAAVDALVDRALARYEASAG